MLKLGNKKSQTSLVERGGPSIEALLPVFVHIVPINEYLLRRLNREAIDISLSTLFPPLLPILSR